MLTFLMAFAKSATLAQTITIHDVDPGPYGQGSTIAIPFTINDAGGCISQTNTFSLYMSDASGNFSSSTPVATISGFYATFFNYTIPSAQAAGAGYKFMVKASNPAVSSAASAAITINNTPAVVAAASSSAISGSYPAVFGQCDGGGSSYSFINLSSSGTTVTATFFNELSHSFEGGNPNIAGGYSFAANAANYTVTIKAVNASGVVGTTAYQLINNNVNASIGTTGNTSVCITGTGAALTYNIDVSSQTGIQNNYPGNTYSFSWGDGSPNSVYTYCQIRADSGKITHIFTKASCGITSNGQNNAFQINFQAVNPYCGNISSTQTSYAKVLYVPLNYFPPPLPACTGSPVTFTNGSTPGPDPNSTTSTCQNNPNALYTWLVDGKIVAQNYTLAQPLVYTFNTNGVHTVTLRAQNASGACVAADYTQNICIQNSPKPIYSLPSRYACIGSGPVVPINASVIDSNCSAANKYIWSVTGPGSVSYAGGTSTNSAQPQFVFSITGVYLVQLSITTASCGTINGAIDTLTVNSTPVTTLSPDFAACGKGITYNFNGVKANNPTYTVLTGTAQQSATTYKWVVTPPAGGGAATYNDTSRYPQIYFPDYGVYTITVTQQNNCGTATATQHINFEQAPLVNGGKDTTVCAGSTIPLHGTVTGSANSIGWTGGTGTFTPSRSALNAVYTPSANENNSGGVALTLLATTSLTAPCDSDRSTVTLTIIPTDTITSAKTKSICSGQPVAYQITARDAPSTYTWSSQLTSGSASGFGSGTGSTINDVLTNNTPTNNATITYTIIPQSNGCTGVPFTLTVNIPALPVITATAPNAAICSNTKANISLASNISGTTYTWTVVAPAGVTGFSTQATPTSSTLIPDVLVNNGTTTATVTYTVTPYSTAVCSGAPVNYSIQVYPIPVTANAGINASLCNVTSYTLQGNSPAPGKGKWSVVTRAGLSFANDTLYNTVVNGLVPGNSYQLQWAITSGPGCQSSSTVTLTDNPDVVASFKAAPVSGCGNVTVQFTNTSGNQSGATFLWAFGDGNFSSAVSPQHTFAPRTDGLDTNYIVSLTVPANCVQRAPVTDTITVRPATPTARILPNQTSGCGSFVLIVQNESPGNNVSYDFYLYNGPTLIQKITKTDKSAAQFNAISTAAVTTFTLYMVATGYCGNTGTSVQIPITISPVTFTAQMFVQNNVTAGCAPLSVSFINNSSGGDLFHYNIYDSNNNIVSQPAAGTGILPYTFTTAGTYYVTITASNNCGTTESAPRIMITVYPLPVPDFSANITSGCRSIDVTFTNLTAANGTTPPTSLSYDWDFGDGSAHSSLFSPPAHVYTYKNGSPYTVTLTVTNNATGCSSNVVKQSYITVNAPPFTAFTEQPDSVTTIPNYQFEFIDQTAGNPVAWQWTFSNGQTSTVRNPSVTFPDTGLYKATLTTTNSYGCDSTVSHYVRITGTPGQLFMPNAFIPSSGTTQLKVFMAKGSGIRSWHMQIFNNYGQLVWETTKLDGKGSPVDGWDGTFKGVPAPEGVYIWQASATFINGTQWDGMSYNGSLPKRAGTVNLLR